MGIRILIVDDHGVVRQGLRGFLETYGDITVVAEAEDGAQAVTLALEHVPDVILMDEPASALDPIATGKIEELIAVLKENYTIVIVTHNMQQAARVSENTAFLFEGKLIEYGKTNDLFTTPREQQTEDYITGRFG